MQKILIVDKTGTVMGNNLLPGAREFLQEQRNRGRTCLMTTVEILKPTVSQETAGLFDGYFESKDFSGRNFYWKDDGSLGKVADDFMEDPEITRINSETSHISAQLRQIKPPSNKQKLEERREALDSQLRSLYEQNLSGLVSKENGRNFQESQRYRNPYLEGQPGKDFYLIKKLYSGNNSVQAVMVGDNDIAWAASDPEVPVIAVPPFQAPFEKIAMLLEQLYTEGKMPHVIFDEWYGSGTKITRTYDKWETLPIYDSVRVTIHDISIILGRRIEAGNCRTIEFREDFRTGITFSDFEA